MEVVPFFDASEGSLADLGIAKDDDRWVPHRRVVAGELQATRGLVCAEDGNVVAALITRIQKLAAGIKGEAAGVIAMRPFFSDVGQFAILADGEDGNAVMQSIAGIDEASIGGEHDLGAEVATRKAWREAGDCLSGGEPTIFGIVVEQDDGGAFFLDGVEPALFRVKSKVTWAIASGQRNEGRIVRRERAFLRIELPDEDLI